jgi:hypothetical protein
LNTKKGKAIKDKRMKRIRIKGKNGLGKNACRTGTAHLLTKAPTGNISYILGPHCTRCLDFP